MLKLVMDHPSQELTRRLLDSRLCTAADLQVAARTVRRLPRDLPPFDSVWIDALVQHRRLSLYQSRVLEHESSGPLVVGQWVVLEELPCSAGRQMYVVRPRDSRELRLMHVFRTTPADHVAAVERLGRTIEMLRGWSHAHVVPVQSLLVEGPQLCVVLGTAPEVTLRERLIRHGRLSPEAVALVGQHVAWALDALHRRGLAYGFLTLDSVWLMPEGKARLCDAALQASVTPAVSTNQALSPDVLDNVAPEWIDSERTADAATDLYALGCLLWNLLAGRPPCWNADARAKLLFHREQRIPDVRELAPNTPAALAEVITRLTAPQAANRPATAAAVMRELQRTRLAARTTLKPLARVVTPLVPHLANTPPRLTWTAPLVTAGALCVGVGLLASTRWSTELLSIARRSLASPVMAVAQPSNIAVTSTATTETWRELPSPDQDGVIQLTAGLRYRAKDVTATNNVIIRGTSGRPAEIVVDRPWIVSAPHVALERLQIRLTGTAGLQWQCNQLDCHYVVLHDVVASPDGAAAIEWQPYSAQPGETSMRWHECIWNLQRAGLAMDVAPRHVILEQGLQVGDGEGLVMTRPNSAGTNVRCERLTSRGQGPWLTVLGAGDLTIDARSCVWDESDHPLVIAEDAALNMQWTGEESLVAEGRTWWRRAGQTWRPDDLEWEGLFPAEVTFAGPASLRWAASVLVDTNAPRTSAELPGIAPR